VNLKIRNNSKAGSQNSAVVVQDGNGTDVNTPVADCPDESFDVLGDPDALADAFFDALAALLLDISKSDKLHQARKENFSHDETAVDLSKRSATYSTECAGKEHGCQSRDPAGRR